MKVGNLLWKGWQLLVASSFLISLVVLVAVHSSYTGNLPHSPDVSGGRTIPLAAKGGVIYASAEEERLWNRSLYAMEGTLGIFFLTAIARRWRNERKKA